jgi:hypothetical protein
MYTPLAYRVWEMARVPEWPRPMTMINDVRPFSRWCSAKGISLSIEGPEAPGLQGARVEAHRGEMR